MHNTDPYNNPWWNRITNEIILGAIPLNNYDHVNELCDVENVKYVISIMNDYEYDTNTPFTDPVKPNDWQNNSVKQLIIKSDDYTGVSINNIIKGVSFIETVIKTIRKSNSDDSLYIHCKGGHGRSVVIVMCYLLKHKCRDYNYIYNYVKNKRPTIKPNKEQQDSIMEYLFYLESTN